MSLPAVNSVWLDGNGVFYLVKFSHPDDERIILSRFDEPNFTTIASYLEGFERIYPRPPLSDADIDRIAERLREKLLPETTFIMPPEGELIDMRSASREPFPEASMETPNV